MSRVLVVDDRDENLEYLRALLTAHGYTVGTARHGAEALESARAVLPDIVVSDLLMPVMDGYTLLRFWKADAALRQVPFVVYSATYVEPEDQQLAMSLGADAFVLKPAEATDFLARLREVQSRPAATSELPGPSEDEKVLLRLYSETLIRKLEEKSRQLEESNRILQLDIVERRKAEDALREREAELRQLTEAMPQIVWVARPDGWPAHFNQRWMEYTGLTLEESLARGWLPVIHPDDRPQAALRWAEATESGKPFEIESRLRQHDGAYRWMLGRALPLRDPAGTILRWMGTCTDIHDLKEAKEALAESPERKRADEALRQSENELRALAESMPQMVWITGASGLNFYLNQRWVEYTGLTLEESYGEGYTEAFHPDDRQRVAMEWERARAARTDYSIECRIRRADGNYRWMLVRGLPFRDDSGRIVKWIGTCTDIHDLKEANTMLREQASLLDMAQDAIIVRDLDHRILYWNRSAERLYGWTAEEVRGRSVDELLYTDAQAFRNATEIVKEKGEWVGEIDQYTKSGRTLTVEGHWSLVRDDQGNPRSVLAINTNITEKKLLEAQFLRAQRMESIGTLARGIAHDFNNLLAPIIMGAGYLQRMESREKVLAVIKNIERSANRGKELVKQVLSFAKGIEGQRITLQLSHIVREVESIIASTFPKNLTFERRIASQLWLVDGDPSQLNQVLLNLCVNARDAMPQGGRLLVTAQNAEVDAQYAAMNREAGPGRYVLLEVTDEGSGMAQEVLDRAFEPFFTTKTHGQGTGLGLSTVIGIVRSHGGFLNVSSEIGKGTTFKVYLPAKIETSESGQEAAVSEALPRGEGELILIVDDEASILSVTKQTLESFGYRAMVAEDGAQAIVLFADHRDEIAVVLTDMMMPVMNGPALIAALRRIDPEVKIIAASGLSTEASGLASGSSGVRHFLSKPYSADHLLILLKTVLSEGE